MSEKKSYKRSFIFLTSLFFLWGFITVLVDSLIPRLRELFTLSYFEAGLVQFAFFGAYFLLSIPASYILSKIGYKRGIILGLITMAVGCLLFYPAASLREFSVFLFGYFTLAGGMTILQVAANPYVTVLGTEEGASSRLNLSQAFNSLGTAIAPAIGALFILSDKIMTTDEISGMSDSLRESYLEQEAAAVQGPFIFLAASIILLAVVFIFVKLPTILNPSSTGTYREALANRNLLLGVIAIFFYVGAEVAIGSYLVNYFLDMGLAPMILENETMRSIASYLLSNDIYQTDVKAIVGVFVTFYWSGAMVGRFVGAYLTRVFNPSTVLGIFSIVAIVLIIVSMSSTGFLSMWSILGVGFFNSIMFPTIFSLALMGLGDLRPKASGLLCTAIVGGAIIPPMYGYFTDVTGFKMALLLPVLCYGYIWYFSRTKKQWTMEN